MVWPWHTAKVVICWCVDVRVHGMVCVFTCACAGFPGSLPQLLDSLCNLGFDLYYQAGALYYQVEEDVTNLFL